MIATYDSSSTDTCSTTACDCQNRQPTEYYAYNTYSSSNNYWDDEFLEKQLLCLDPLPRFSEALNVNKKIENKYNNLIVPFVCRKSMHSRSGFIGRSLKKRKRN